MFISYKAVVSEIWSSIKAPVQIMGLAFKGQALLNLSHFLVTEEMNFLSFVFFFFLIRMILLHSKGFPGGSGSKESA